MARSKHLKLLDSNSDYMELVQTMTNSILPTYYNKKIVGTISHFAEAFIQATSELGMDVELDPLGFDIMAVHGETNESLDIMLDALHVTLDAIYEADADMPEILHLVLAIENYIAALNRIRYDEAGRVNRKH